MEKEINRNLNKQNKKKKTVKSALIGLAAIVSLGTIGGVTLKLRNNSEKDPLQKIRIEKTVLDDIKDEIDDELNDILNKDQNHTAVDDKKTDTEKKKDEKEKTIDTASGYTLYDGQSNNNHQYSIPNGDSNKNPFGDTNGNDNLNQNPNETENPNKKPGEGSDKDEDSNKNPGENPDKDQDSNKNPGGDSDKDQDSNKDPEEEKPEHKHNLKEEIISDWTYDGKNADGEDIHKAYARMACETCDYEGDIYEKKDVCEYNEWHSKGKKGEARECDTCKHEDTRTHDLKTVVGNWTPAGVDEAGNHIHKASVQQKCETCDYVEDNQEKIEQCNINTINDEKGITEFCPDCGYSILTHVHSSMEQHEDTVGSDDICYTSYEICADGCGYKVDHGAKQHEFTQVVDYDDWSNPTMVEKRCSHINPGGAQCNVTKWFAYEATKSQPTLEENVQSIEPKEASIEPMENAQSIEPEVAPSEPIENVQPVEPEVAPSEPIENVQSVEPEAAVSESVEEVPTDKETENETQLDNLVAAILDFYKFDRKNQTVEMKEEKGKTLVLRSRC